MTREDEIRKCADSYAAAARDLESAERDRISLMEKVNRANERIGAAKREFAKILSAEGEQEIHVLLPMYNGRRDLLHVKNAGDGRIEVAYINAII